MDRKLAVILAADVAGYSRLVADDEEGTLATLARYRTVIAGLVGEHGGRIFGTAGDSILAEFSSAVQAAKSAIAIQQRVGERNVGLPGDRRMEFRIGLHLGDVVVEGTDLLGDGINVAARLQQIAEPAGILVSGVLREHLDGRLDVGIVSLGERSLKNIPRPVAVHRIDWREGRPAADVADRRPARTRYSIAVLPFDNINGDPGQSYLSEGITEDITTELARFRGLAVAARHASEHASNKKVAIAELRQLLGVDYVVEGSVRRTGERMRITAQLIDAATGSHVWAERYDREIGDTFAVIDEAVAAIAASVMDQLALAEAAQTRRRPPDSWTAYDYVLQGREIIIFHHAADSIPLLERALSIDPGFAHAHAWLGLARSFAFVDDLDRRHLDLGVEAGQRALSLDPSEAIGHWACAMGQTWKGQLDAAGRHFDRAIALNPSNLQIRADRANWLRYSERHAEALSAIEEAIRQGAFAPDWFKGIRGRILLDLGRYQDAVAALDTLSEKGPWTYLYLVAAHGHNGDPAAAAEASAASRRARPGVSLSAIAEAEPFKNRARREHLLDGLRKARCED